MLFCGGWFAALRRSSGRHKWRPYVCERSNVVLRRPFCGVARRGAIHDARCRNGTIGRPRWASADVACCGRFVVLRRSSGCRKWRPHVWGRLNVVLRWPFCGFASVVRASRVAPVRLRGGRMLFCGGHPGVTSGAPTFAVRLNVVWRRPVRGVARRGAIHDARCRNGTIGRPCGFFEPSGKGGLHSGGCPKILCFQIVVPHVCITFAA